MSWRQKKNTKRINETKRWFFGKMLKIDGPLTRIIKKKKRGPKLKNQK